MKKKLFSTYILLIVVTVIAMGISNLIFVKKDYRDSIKDKLISNGNLICESLKIHKPNDYNVNYFFLAQNFSKQTSLQISFIDDKGVVLADSHNNSIILEGQVYKDEIESLYKKGNIIKEQFNSPAHEEYMYIYMSPINIDNKDIVVRLGMSLKEVNKLGSVFIGSEALSIGIALIISMIIGYFFLESIIKPINQLRIAAKNISEGQFNYKVDIKTGDELEELANSFNIMSSKINSTINELKSMEVIRKDFVANVSHELKTPITIINGFIDTLKNNLDESKETKTRYLNIISLEIERLRALIDDILMLSKLDNINNYNRSDKVNIFKEIDYVVSILNPIAAEKNVVLDVDIEKNFIIYVCNKEWVTQMLLNLVENAIKYNKIGGLVKISAFTEANKGVFIIKDNGVGIAEEDKDKVFERFYRIDKSRSRKYGGTGLGLSIVKNIVLAFGGTIELKCGEKEGCEFIIRIPME